MTDIHAFLTARYDELQAAAEAAHAADPTPWTADTDRTRDTPERGGHGFGLVIAADNIALWDCEGSSTLCMTAPTAEHVARHDPARVLADVAAKRRILARHHPTSGPNRIEFCDGCGFDYGDISHRYLIHECPELLDLAAPFADHEDYDEAWRP